MIRCLRFLISFLFVFPGYITIAQHIVPLADIPMRNLINTYGYPVKNQSFARTPFLLKGKRYAEGIGLHAPAKISIDLNGMATRFVATIGLDEASKLYYTEQGLDSLGRKLNPTFPADYVYDNKRDHDDPTAGGTAILTCWADGKKVFDSGLITVNTNPIKIDISLKDVQKFTIEIDPTLDGSYIDYVDLVESSISFDSIPKDLHWYHQIDDIILNHVGFHSFAPKTCYKAGSKLTAFEVWNIESNTLAFRGEMIPKKSSYGEYIVGDFSPVTVAGKYAIKIKDTYSHVFRIDQNVLKDCLENHLFYISQQRSGHSTKGWRPAQNLDDGLRSDGKGRINAKGGWNDACDLNKSTSSNISVCQALLSVLKKSNTLDSSLVDEFKWGNDYLHRMQDSSGFIYATVLLAQWTDNIVGTSDDRVVNVSYAGLSTQLAFCLTEYTAYEVFKNIDKTYAQKCLISADKAYSYAQKTLDKLSLNQQCDLIELYCIKQKIAPQAKWQFKAEEQLRAVLQLAVLDATSNIFYLKLNDEYTSKMATTLVSANAFLSFINTFPSSKLVPKVKQVLDQMWKNQYQIFSASNAFELMPWVISNNVDQYQNKLSNFSYNFFKVVGVNSNMAFKANEYISLYQYKKDLKKIALAQKYLDWIYGANPFNSSGVMKVGYNHTTLFEAGEKYFAAPRTPLIKGGVITGIAAYENDELALFPGWWWTAEYWGPLNANVIQLVNQLDALYNEK